MSSIKIEGQEGDIITINLRNLAWYREVKVGRSLQVTFKTIDGQKFTSIVTPESLMKLDKMFNSKKMI